MSKKQNTRVLKGELMGRPVSECLWNCVKALSTLALVAVTVFKIYETPVDMTLDFPTMLSILLAFFSVGLSTLFYFKATETSNAFHKDAQQFNRDMGQVLAKIESGFGERLRSLDEGYSHVRDQLASREQFIAQTREDIEVGEKEWRATKAQKDEIISGLIEKANLQDEERNSILRKLEEKDQQLDVFQAQMNDLQQQLYDAKSERKMALLNPRWLARYTYQNVVKVMGEEFVRDASPDKIARQFDRIEARLDSTYINALSDRGWFDSGLTVSGANYIKQVQDDLGY